MALLGYRQGDTFSYATVAPLTLPTSAWTATMALSDPKAPNRAGPTPPTVVVVALGVNAGDATKSDYQVVLHADTAITAAWPAGPCQLRGVISFADGLGNRTSTFDFVVAGRA